MAATMTKRCCEAVHKPGQRFYVTVRDAGRTGWLLGPYGTHAEALANVKRGHDAANLANGWAWFYEYGTAGVDGTVPPIKTLFGK